jgi:hypothetical protein
MYEILGDLASCKVQHMGSSFLVNTTIGQDGSLVITADLERDPGLGVEQAIPADMITERLRSKLRELVEQTVHELATQYWPSLQANMTS